MAPPASIPAETPGTSKRGSRTPRSLASLAAITGGLLFLGAGALLTLTRLSIIQEASQIEIKPSRISLDAAEGRGRALMSVDAELTSPQTRVHGLSFKEGHCDLHGAGDGTPLLSMHLVEALYHGATQAHFGIELEHGSIQKAFSIAQESSTTPTLDCVLGIELDPFRTGWTFRTQRAMTLPMNKMLEGTGSGYNVRFAKRESREVVMPTLSNLTAAGTATYGLEFVIPTAAVTRILPSFENIPMDIKAGVAYVEGDLGAVDSRMHIDAPVELRTEGTGPGASTVFAVPVQVSARADLMAASTVLSAAAIGERAQRDPEAGLHYHIQPTAGDSRPPHSVVFAAANPSSAIAKALGALHTVSLQPDEELGADTLAEALAKGRQLLGRKLSGGTLGGYGVRLHQHLLLDNTLKMRVDLTATGSTPEDPVLQIGFRTLLRLPDSRQSSWGFGWDWQDGGSAIGTTARLRLDHQTPAISGGLAVSYVDVSTTSSGGTNMYNAEWEHRVTNVTNNLEFSYDGTTQLATFGLTFDMATSGEQKWDSNNTATTWAASTDENSPAKVWWRQNSEVRRLLSKFGDIAWQTGTALRRLSIMESKSETNIPVRVSASMDFNGVSPSSVFTADIRVEAADMVNFALDWRTTEPAAYEYVHSLGVMLDLPEAEEVEAGQVIAPFLAAGASIQDESRLAEERVKLKMAFQGSANVTTDFSDYLTLKVDGTVSMSPTCAVSELDETLPKIVPLLENASASFDASNPQCRRCLGGYGRPFGHESSGRLVSMCGSSERGWQETRWGSASSCCDFRRRSTSLRTLGGLLAASGVPQVAFGSPWTKPFRFEASMGETLTDIWPLLENEIVLPLMGGIPPQISAAVTSARIVPEYATSGNTTVRTWKLIIAGDDFARLTMLDKSPNPQNWFNIDWHVLVDLSDIPIFHMMMKEEWTDQKFLINMTQVLRYKPEYNLQALALFDTMQDGLDGFAFDHYVKFGADLGQLYRLCAQAMLTDGTIAGSGDLYLGENKTNSALLRFVSAGSGMEGTATVKDGWDMTTGTGNFALLARPDKLTLTGNVSDAWSKLGSMLFNAERLNGGNTYATTLGVMEGTGAVLAGFLGSFTTTADSLSATLNGQELARASGSFSPAMGTLSAALRAAGQELVRASGSFSPDTGSLSAALSTAGQELVRASGSFSPSRGSLSAALNTAGQEMVNTSASFSPTTGSLSAALRAAGQELVRASGSFSPDTGSLSAALNAAGQEMVNASASFSPATGSLSAALRSAGQELVRASGSFSPATGSLRGALNAAGQDVNASASFSPATGSLSAALHAAGQELVRASGSFSPATGVLSAALSAAGGEVFQATGAIPKVDSFFVGDVALEIAGLRQRFWMNVSDGYLPFTKAGLSGFQRFYLGGGTVLEGSIAMNASIYWEVPPLDPTCFSGVGIFADVDTLGDGRENIANVAIDADFPYAKVGWSPNGEQMQVVSEFITEVKGEMTLDDFSTYDLDAFRLWLLIMGGIDLRGLVKFEIKRVDYKVEVAYEFTAAVTEAEAKTSIASAVGVREDQVSVTITNSSRRLFSDLLVPRRLSGGLRVDAVIKTDTSAAADAVKGKALDIARVSQELTSVGENLTASIAVHPVAKAEVTMMAAHELEPIVEPEALKILMLDKKMVMTGDINRELVRRVVVVTTPTTTPDEEEGSRTVPVTTTEGVDLGDIGQSVLLILFVSQLPLIAIFLVALAVACGCCCSQRRHADGPSSGPTADNQI